MKLNTINGAALMSQPLRPPNFVVDSLLAQGLHILAGSPKVGKSWLALWLGGDGGQGRTSLGHGHQTGPHPLSLPGGFCAPYPEPALRDHGGRAGERPLLHGVRPHRAGAGGTDRNLLVEHPGTVLVIIDTLQMVRPIHDATYANDYRDLSVLKRLADHLGLAILLIHHLRKEKAEDVFHRISGTTAISGAVDSSFTLVEERRGSGRAKLTCIGRDIEYRELELERNADNVWELLSDSRTHPELLEGQIAVLLSEFLKEQSEFIGTPTELSQRIDPDRQRSITPKKVSRLILQSVDALRKVHIKATIRRSNGKRIIELHSADSDDTAAPKEIGTIDPVGQTVGGGKPDPGRGRFLPFGRASIASGYTPAAVPGHCPGPQP